MGNVNSEILNFIGDKSHTLSFRLKTHELKNLLDGEKMNVEIKGKKFAIKKM